MYRSLARLVVIYFILLFKQSYAWNPIVNTPLGRIRGFIKQSRSGLSYVSYLGIKYGQVNERFEEASPVGSWNETLDATIDGPLCPQISTSQNMSEDCLILNVFVSLKSPYIKPVIVYIHGGALVRGGGHDSILGSEYLMDHDIVLVTINYRLGSFGFLSTGTQDAPGNIGCKDQVLALKWINQNILSFDGDKNRVTLFGQSAGGQTIVGLMASPLATGLFHGAIIMSGTLTAQWKVPTNLLNLAKRQAKFLGCPYNTPSNIVNCLKNVPMMDLVKSTEHLTDFGGNPINLFSPVVENDFGQKRFLIEDPTLSFETGNFNQVPVITGVTRDEFVSTAFNILHNKTLRWNFDEHFDDLAPICLFYERNTRRSHFASTELRNSYLNTTLTLKSLQNMSMVFSDGIRIFGVHRFVHLIAKYVPVYYYLTTFIGRFSYFYYPDNKPFGVAHTDDLQYLFHIRNLSSTISTSDPESAMVDRMTRLWTNFALNGNPNNNRDPIVANIFWTPFDFDLENYMNLGNEFKMENELFLDRMALWERLFPLHNDDKIHEIILPHNDMEITVFSQTIWILPKDSNRFRREDVTLGKTKKNDSIILNVD